jgi:glycosyltransferase involved in cell wall biosynthesis
VIVLDALQVSSRYSGVGRQALEIGRELHELPEPLALEVRCPADLRPVLEAVFPAQTRFRTPIRRSQPRPIRIAYQQAVAPARDPAGSLLVCLGDQGPMWGRAPVLLVVNDVRRLTHPETSSALESRYYRLLVPRAVRHARIVVTISEFSRDEIRKVFGDDLVVEVVAHHPSPRASAPAGGGSHLLTVGALRQYKGIETAIDALALVSEEERPELVFAGPGEGREEELSRYAAARGVADRIRFLGWVDESRLGELYASALATVNPSTYEGYGLPVAESLSHGLATIASEIPPHREVAGDAALYFEPGDAAGLGAAISRVAGDARFRLELAERGLERSRALAQLRPRWSDVIRNAVAKLL